MSEILLGASLVLVGTYRHYGNVFGCFRVLVLWMMNIYICK